MFPLQTTLTPPNSAAEAILSRRNTCYGFAVVAYLEQFPEVHDLLTETRKKIIQLIDPDRREGKSSEGGNCPRKSENYIKVKSLHAAVFGAAPSLRQEEYYTCQFFQKPNTFSDNEETRKIFFNSLKTAFEIYQIEKAPQLEPLGLECKPQDGTILARYRFLTNDGDARPLDSLKKTMDPAGVLPVWDPHPLRDTTVAITLCTANLSNLSQEIIAAIMMELENASELLRALGNQFIQEFTIVEYNKRTLTRNKHAVEAISDVSLSHRPSVTLS